MHQNEETGRLLAFFFFFLQNIGQWSSVALGGFDVHDGVCCTFSSANSLKASFTPELVVFSD